jgi:DNA polymerase III subunit beta
MIKLSFKREELLKAMDYCIGSIEKKNTMPILSHVLFDFHDDQCTLLSTNLETSVIVKLSLPEPSETGKIAVPAKYIYDICKVGRGEIIYFKYDKATNVLDINSEKTKYVVPCSDADDFPSISTVSSNEKVVNIHRMIASFKKLQFSMTEQNVNKAYSGVLINKVTENDVPVIEMVTTDIHRISVVTLKDFNLDLDNLENGIVIPGRNFSELAKIFTDKEEINVAVEDDKISFNSENVTFISRLLKNEFPNYRTVIGGYSVLSEKESSVINRKELIDGVKRVIALSSDDKIWATKFSFKNSVLSMTANAQFGGNSKDEILVQKPFESDKEVGINARYLIDVLSVLDKNETTMIVEEGLKPLTILEETETSSYVHMVMPLRI